MLQSQRSKDQWLKNLFQGASMATPNHTKKRKDTQDVDAAPSSKRLRTAKAMNYDMKYHPMDDTMRPHQSAMRKAAHGLGTRPPTTTSASTASLADDSEDTLSLESDDSPKIRAVTGHGPQTRAGSVRLPIRPKLGSPSTRRITRGEQYGEKVVDYDMKHHPMDDILCPRQSANRRSAHIAKASSSTEYSESPGQRIHEPHNNDTPANRDGILETPTRVYHSGIVTVIRNDRPRSGDSDQRVTRKKNREKPVGYNVKYHPMDTSLRPAQAKRQLARWSTRETGLSLAGPPNRSRARALQETKGTEAESRGDSQISPSYTSAVEKSRSAVLPYPSDPAAASPVLPNESAANARQNLAAQPVAASWRSLTDEDRSLYVLQQGAPSGGQTLPMRWPDVATALQVNHGARIITSTIRSRYETVRQSVQNYFDAEPEPTKPDDITMRYAEGFDVYDYEPGAKYWRHSIDSVVEPKDITAGDPDVPRQVPICAEMFRAQPKTPNQSKTFSDKHPEVPEKAKIITSHDAKRNVRHKARDISRATKGRVSVRFVETNDSQSEEDDIDGRGINASLNDADAYRQQSMGMDQFDDESIDESPEKDIVTTMRGGISTNTDNLLQPDELTPEFRTLTKLDCESENEVNRDTATVDKREGEDEDEEEESTEEHPEESSSSDDELSMPPCRLLPTPFNRRKKRIQGFTVLEDQPGNTPRIKRMVSKHPRSPGTDIPKENMRERSPSDGR